MEPKARAVPACSILILDYVTRVLVGLDASEARMPQSIFRRSLQELDSSHDE